MKHSLQPPSGACALAHDARRRTLLLAAPLALAATIPAAPRAQPQETLVLRLFREWQAVSDRLDALGVNTSDESLDEGVIEQTAERMIQRAGGGRVGRAGLWSEIEEVLKDPEMAEAVVLTAIDVAEGDRELEAAEKAVLERLAKVAGIDLHRMLAA